MTKIDDKGGDQTIRLEQDAKPIDAKATEGTEASTMEETGAGAAGDSFEIVGAPATPEAASKGSEALLAKSPPKRPSPKSKRRLKEERDEARKRVINDPAALESLRIEASNIAQGIITSSRQREAYALMHAARRIMIEHAKPPTKVLGWKPTRRYVEESLARAFREQYDRSPDPGELMYLEGPFFELIDQFAEDLGLAGQRERTKAKRQPRLPSKESAAAKVQHARRLARDAESFSIAIATIPDGSERVLNSQARADELIAEADELMEGLSALGNDADGIQDALKPTGVRAEALDAAQGIEGIHDELLFMYVDSMLDHEDERTDALMSLIEEDAEEWIKGNGAKYGADAQQLKTALRVYLSFWLHEHPGKSFMRIGYSQEAMRHTRMHLERGTSEAAAGAKLAQATARMIGNLTWLTPDHVGSKATPSSWSAKDFETAVGKALFDDLNRHRRGIKSSKAEAFFGLFLNYAQYAAIAHPERNVRDILVQDGLDARIVRAIYSNPRHASEYGTESLKLLRDFFAQHVTPNPVPELADLLPMKELAAEEPKPVAAEERNFVEPAETMRDYVRNMRIPLNAKFEEEFKIATGYSLQNFLSWGSRMTAGGDMSDVMWSTLINLAVTDVELRDLLRRYPPEGVGKAEFNERIASLGSTEELATFAVNHKPSKIGKSDWERYAAHWEERGYSELVTVLPRTRAALEAMTPAFSFMQREAASYGMAVDVWDFLSAIYPIARRFRERATAGKITIRVPSFMSGLQFRNWGLETWAGQIIEAELPTTVPRDTQLRHSRGQVQTEAERLTMLRYIEPLAKGDPEQARTLYEFTELLRFIRLLDSAGHVYDASDSRVSYAPAATPNRYTVHLEDDLTTYEAGEEILIPGLEGKLFEDIKEGHYSHLLDTADEHIQSLGLLPSNIVIMRSGNREATISELTDELEKYRAGEIFYRRQLSDSSGMASQRTADDRVTVRRFFSRLRGVVQEIIHGMRVHGSVYTNHGPLEFQAAVRKDGRTNDYKRQAKPLLYVDDLWRASRRRGWDRDRVNELILMRILVNRAIAYGDLTESEATRHALTVDAVDEMWPGDKRSLERAAKDYTALETAPVAKVAPAREGAIRILRKARSERCLREPVLPGSRLTPSWQDQWGQYALENAIDGRLSEIALDALGTYFERALDLHVYSGEALLGAIGERIDAASYSEADRSREEIMNDIAAYASIFLPTIGVAGGATLAAIPEGTAKVEGELARRVVDEYRQPFPQRAGERSRVPIIEARLMRIAHVHCIENKRHNPRPFIVFSTAKALLTDYNKGIRETSSPLEHSWTSELEGGGMLSQRLSSFADGRELNLVRMRHAYLRLYEAAARGSSIDEAEMRKALAASHDGEEPTEADVEFLRDFLTHQRSAMMSWRSVVSNPSIGLSAYVRRNYNFAGDARMDLALFEAFANAYAEARILTAKGVDPVKLSLAVAERVLGGDTEVKIQLAGFLRSIFESWIMETMTELKDNSDLARMEVVDVVNEAGNLEEMNASDIMARAAENVGVDSIDKLAAIEDRLAIFGQIIGTSGGKERLAEYAKRLRVEEIGRRNEEAERVRLAAIEGAELLLAGAAGRAGALAWRAAEAYSRWREIPPIDEMSEGEVEAMVGHTDREFDITSAIAKELDRVQRISAQGAAVLQQNGANMDPGLDPSAFIESTREYLKRTELAVIDAMERGVQQLADIAETARYEKEHKTKQAAEERAAEAMSAAGNLMNALRTQANDIESIELQLEDLEERARTFSESMESKPARTHEEFATALTEARSIEKSIETIAAGAGEVEARLVDILNGTHDDLPPAEAALDKLVDAQTEIIAEQSVSLSEAYDRLERMSADVSDAGKSVEGIKGRSKSAIRSIDTALDAVEAKLPIGPAVGIPEVDGIDHIAARASNYKFVEITLKDDRFWKQGSSARKLAHEGMILSRGDGSRLVMKKDAGAVEVWMRGERSNDLTVYDAFGNRIELRRGERGVRLASIEEIPEGHPFAALIETLGNAIAEPTNEARLIAMLSKSSLRKFFVDLLATMAANRCETGGDARELVRAWALSRRPKLAEALQSMHARKFFAHMSETPQPGTSDGQGWTLPKNYTAEAHTRQARRYLKAFADPGSIGEEPSDIRRVQIMHRIYSDTEFMNLGWLFTWSEKNDSTIYAFLEDLIAPIARTRPGQPAPITLKDAQAEAVGAYRSLTEGVEMMPEVERVPEAQLVDWIRAPLDASEEGDAQAGMIIDEARRRGFDHAKAVDTIEKQMQSNTVVRHTLAKALILSVWSKLHATTRYDEILAAVEAYVFSTADGKGDRAREAGAKIRSLYNGLRPKVLKSKRVLQIVTGMHDPQSMAPFATQNAQLAKIYPETGKVGASQRWSITKLHQRKSLPHPDSKAGLVRALGRILEIFPEFANAIAFMTIGIEDISRSVEKGLKKFASDYDASADFKNDLEIDEYRTRFIELYGKTAPDVRRGVGKKQVGEMDGSHWLTGEEEPGKARNGWKAFAPIEWLEASLPEVANIPDEYMDEMSGTWVTAIKQNLGHLDPNDNPFIWMREFANRYKAFKKAIITLSIVASRLHKDFLNGRLFKFFENGHGAWNDAALAAKFIGSSAGEVDPAEAFVRMLIEPGMLAAIRKAMDKPMPGEDGGLSILQFLYKFASAPAKSTGSEGVGTVESTDNIAFLRHVDTWIRSTGLLPSSSSELKAMMDGFIVKEEILANANKPSLTVNPADPAQFVFVKIMLLIEQIDSRTSPAGETSRNVNNSFRKAFFDWAEGKGSMQSTEMLRFAYKFLTVDCPNHVEAAKRGVRRKAGGGGGNGSSGSAAPTSSSSSGSTPPPTSGHGANPLAREIARSRPQVTGNVPVRIHGLTTGVANPIVVPRPSALPLMGAQNMLRPTMMPMPIVTSGMMVH